MNNKPKKKATRYRRSTALVAFWEGVDLVLENYVKGSRTPAPPQLASVILDNPGPLSMTALVRALTPLGYVTVLAPLLIARGVFVRIGSSLDRKERAIETNWAAWGAAARHFYFSTSHTRFRMHEPADDAAFVNREDPPSPFHDRKGPRVPLPPFSYETADRFFEVLRARRTLRMSSGEEIALDDFSRVLRWTWGATHVIDSRVMRRFILRTSPSGGGRHPTEVYAAVMRVSGLTPGIYHYSVRREELTLLKEGFFEDDVVRVCCQGDFLRGTPVVFFMTSIVQRSMWKYPVAHALRVLLLDAGHLGQTFHLVSTALGLAPYSFAATDTAGIEKLLAIDGVREIPIYTCALGVPVERDTARSDRLGRAVDLAGPLL